MFTAKRVSVIELAAKVGNLSSLVQAITTLFHALYVIGSKQSVKNIVLNLIIVLVVT
jgi:hypothetical protein